MLYQLVRIIQDDGTHKVTQASKDWSSGAQDPQVRKIHKSHDQHKVYGRGLDMVVCHTMLFMSYIHDLHKSEVSKLPQTIMGLACEVLDLYETLFGKFKRLYKSKLSGWHDLPSILRLEYGIRRYSQDHGLMTLGWPWQCD